MSQIAARLVPISLLALLSTAVVAIAAPSNTAPPTISGTAAYDSKLTCNEGSWSGAASLDYSWDYGGRGTAQWASGKSVRIPANVVSRPIACTVTATDAAGATTTASSARVVPTAGKPRFKYSLRSLKPGRLRLKGVAGPRSALVYSSSRATVVLYRELGRRRYRQPDRSGEEAELQGPVHDQRQGHAGPPQVPDPVLDRELGALAVAAVPAQRDRQAQEQEQEALAPPLI